MRAAVLGSPVAHSLSPVLHTAAYRALGLAGWSYERVECDAATLPAWLAARDAGWAGVSVTMPGKRAALEVADEVSPRARTVDAVNTLVRRPDGGWAGDCTDVDGVTGALRAAGAGAPGSPPLDEVAVLGAGGTAAAVAAAATDLGARRVTLVVREPARADRTRATAEALGPAVTVTTWDEAPPAVAQAGVLVNTTPAGAADAVAERLVAALPAGAVVLDAIYHPWPTPLAAAASARGLPVAGGLEMLLHQAFGQVEQFTGRPAPRTAMWRALGAATGQPLRPPDRPVPRAGDPADPSPG